MNQGGKEVSKMKITVHDDRLGSQQLSVDEMAALALFPEYEWIVRTSSGKVKTFGASIIIAVV
jgi:hypothetical protein